MLFRSEGTINNTQGVPDYLGVQIYNGRCQLYTVDHSFPPLFSFSDTRRQVRCASLSFFWQHPSVSHSTQLHRPSLDFAKPCQLSLVRARSQTIHHTSDLHLQPACSYPCFVNPNLGGCAATNYVCLCNNQEYLSSTSTCILQHCSGADLTTTYRISQATCLAVVRPLQTSNHLTWT